MKRASSIALLFSATLVAAAPAAAAGVKLETDKSAQHGTYVTDSKGRALYMFEADKQGKRGAQAQSNCYDACASAWPPLIAEDDMPQAGAQLDESLIGTIERNDGKKQVTYNGWPLYYFVKDKGKGQASGQDVKGFGGEWYLLGTEGEKVGHAATGGTGKAR
jgi:predicted lipoprotein with Yx(FWY)xxD motif